MRVLLKLLPLLVITSLGLGPVAFADLTGAYEAIGPVPAAHSQDVVKMEEFINFTCPHCNNFLHAAKPVMSKYGKRVTVVTVPILFRGQVDAPLRLYFIAERAGRGKEVEELIFDATFRYGVDVNDPKIVGYLARTAGLADQFQSEAGAPWVNEKIKQASIRADQAGVEATPTIVLNGTLRLVPRTGMQEFVTNLDQLIGQLLKK